MFFNQHLYRRMPHTTLNCSFLVKHQYDRNFEIDINILWIIINFSVFISSEKSQEGNLLITPWFRLIADKLLMGWWNNLHNIQQCRDSQIHRFCDQWQRWAFHRDFYERISLFHYKGYYGICLGILNPWLVLGKTHYWIMNLMCTQFQKSECASSQIMWKWFDRRINYNGKSLK